MQLVPVILLDVLTYGSWLFIVSLGLTLIFGVLRILNIAHGSVYAMGAYVATSVGALLASQDQPIGLVFPAMVLATFAISVIVGLLVERLMLARFYGRGEIVLLLVTYALFLVAEDVTKLIWGTAPRYVTGPYDLLGTLQLGAATLPAYDLLLVVLAVACGGLAWLLLHRTRFGKVVIAVIENPEISRSFGVNTQIVYAASFCVGLFFAAMGGAFTAPMIAVQPGLSASVIITSFAVVVIGGLGSIPGAALGALIVSLARVLSVHFAPSLEIFSIYLAMVATLLFRPQGLFVGPRIRRI